MRLLIFVLFSFVITFLQASSSVFNIDSTQISLLTVMPRSNEVYTIYGHSALRVCDKSANIDIVFNYGTFDSSKPFFVYHFLKGETDYYLDDCSFDYFKYAYALGGATVDEQILDLSVEEKESVIQKLLINLQPENRVYRYNFLFDNCTTRIRDLIENSVQTKVVYPEQKESVTFRELIHSCTYPYPWMTFGIDLLIGNGADSLINYEDEMFLPKKLMQGFSDAVIFRGNAPQNIHPLILDTRNVLSSAVHAENKRSEVSPLVINVILLLIVLSLGVFSLWRGLKFRFLFGLLFFVAAITGTIVWFIALISTHPCTFPNYNMIWLHPFYLILVVGYVISKSNKFITWFHWSNFVLLSLFLAFFWIIPQEINVASLPVIVVLLVSSAIYLLNNRFDKVRLFDCKKKKKIVNE